MLLTGRVVVDRELVADRMTLLIEDPCFDLAMVARPIFHILPSHDDEAVIGLGDFRGLLVLFSFHIDLNLDAGLGAVGIIDLQLNVGIVGIANSVLTPYMLNPSAWNWGNYAGFFWAGICALCVVYTYFRLPEPRGRTFAELDLLFERGISAREFAATKVDVFTESVNGSRTSVDKKGGVDGQAEELR